MTAPSGNAAPLDSDTDLPSHGRLLSTFIELGTDLGPLRPDIPPLVVRRLRVFDQDAGFPREDPGGTTSLVVQIYSGLIPAEESGLDALIELGELAGFPQVTIPALRMTQMLATALVDDSFLPFSIEPAWARTMARMVQDLTGSTASAATITSARKAQIRRVVERFSSDPRLTPVSLAETLEISRRTLYDLSTSSVGGISEFIRANRARRAVRMLVDPVFDRVPLGEIAERSGFSSTKHLKRALTMTYDATPAAIRRSRDSSQWVPRPSQAA